MVTISDIPLDREMPSKANDRNDATTTNIGLSRDQAMEAVRKTPSASLCRAIREKSENVKLEDDVHWKNRKSRKNF